MNAVIQIFLIINILLPDVFSALSDVDKQILQLAEKQVILNGVYRKYSENMFQFIDEQAKQSDTVDVEMVPATLEQVLASLFDRYVGVQMNILCWSCSLYYGTGKVVTDDDRQKANKCQKVGKVLSRYNEMFTAQIFIRVYDNAHPIKNNAEGINMSQVAQNIDNVSKNLKIINDLFKKYELNFNTIFEILETNIQNGEEDETEGLISSTVTWLKLWHYLGEDYLEIANYMRSLVGLVPEVGDWDGLMQPIDFLKTIWSYILEVADDADSGYVKMAQEISSLKEKCFKADVQIRNLKIPSDFGEREWSIVTVNNERFSDFEIQLQRASTSTDMQD